VARKVEEQLDGLTPLREAPVEEALPALRKALGDRVNLVVAKAARIAAERQFQALLPELVQAFSRLFDDPLRRDPQCWGKTALAAALKDLGYSESAPYLRGLRHRQMEPVWGGDADTAESLRGTCLLALVACSDVERGEALRCFVDALTEPAHTIRIEAARALGQMAGDEGALVLRLKARLGDESPEVTGQVFDSLLAIEGARALPFLAGFLKHTDERAEEAALALGSSRLEGGFDLLRQAWNETRDRQFRAVLLRAISLSRLDAALDWLLGVVREGRLADATAALEALALHTGSEEIRGQAKAAAEGREPELMTEFQKRFPQGSA
jgi:HEAT repeat protein